MQKNNWTLKKKEKKKKTLIGSVLYIILYVNYILHSLERSSFKNCFNNIVNLKTFIQIKTYKICLSINYK